MASNFYGVSAYQQAQSWNSAGKTGSARTNSARTVSTGQASSASGSAKASEGADSAGSSKVETKAWSPIDTKSSLVPSVKEGYGMTIGDVNLSDDAKSYYEKLKKKFGNSEFILVSKDMKSQVQQNAAAYGNSKKMVVLIDEEKLERMATDESFRKKYEGIIAMSQSQMAAAKNSLASSGASVKNFGMSVNSDGTTSMFATLEKSSDAQAKRIEKKAAEKKELKAKEKKAAEKKAQEARIEKAKEKRRAEKADSSEKADGKEEDKDAAKAVDDREYVEIRANSLDELIGKVQQFAYDNSARGVMADAERVIGQNFDFKF